jgi:hypothetical protein
MQFDWDPAKNTGNRQKHGFDFVDAACLWADVDAISFAARSQAEPRRALIARHAGKLWTAIYTMRGASVRIISIRRARDNEKALYEQ